MNPLPKSILSKGQLEAVDILLSRVPPDFLARFEGKSASFFFMEVFKDLRSLRGCYVDAVYHEAAYRLFLGLQTGTAKENLIRLYNRWVLDKAGTTFRAKAYAELRILIYKELGETPAAPLEPLVESINQSQEAPMPTLNVKHQNTPLAQVTLVFGKEAEDLTEGEYFSAITRIQDEIKGLEALGTSSEHITSKIKGLKEHLESIVKLMDAQFK